MASVRVLSDDDVAAVLDVSDLLDVVADAFVKQGRGEVERPERPHFPIGTGSGGDPAGTGLVMPAYVHGDETFTTKIVAVHEANAERGLPTVNAQIVLTDAETGQPRGVLAGNRITNARTGCIGGLAARHLATGPVRLGILGAGTQARWQTRGIAAAADLRTVRVYSPSDSRVECAAALAEEFGIDAEPVDSPREAVADATVVVTATTATEPVFPGEALDPGVVVVAIGAYAPTMQEVDNETMDRAARVFADTPEEVAEIGDVRGTGLDPSSLVPFADLLAGRTGRENEAEILVVESVGNAVLDAAAAAHVHRAATERGIGTTVELD